MHLDSDIRGTLFQKISENEYVLEIADGAEISEPIELKIVDCDSDVKLTIQMGYGAKATVIERFECSENLNIHYQHQIIAEAHSYLKVVTIQNLPDNSNLTEVCDVKADKFANVHLLNFQLGGKVVRGNIKQNAMGESSNISIDMLCRVRKKQDFNFNLSNSFHARNGSGKILLKGIALDESSLTINGKIQIDQTGGGTNTHLKQDCLLLSKKAKIKTTPSLNIDTDNVKAGHGASVSNINNESLFYLTSRGLSPDSARKLLITGFVAEVVDKLGGLEEVKDYIITHI